MRDFGRIVRRVAGWSREHVELAPVAVFVVLVAYVWLAFPGLFILLKLALLILLAAGCTVAYVILHDGPSIARAAASAKLAGEPIQSARTIRPTTVTTSQLGPGVSLPASEPSYSPGPAWTPTPYPALEPEPGPGPTEVAGRSLHVLTLLELYQAGIVTEEQRFMGIDMLTGRPVYAQGDEGPGCILDTGSQGSGKTSLIAVQTIQIVRKAKRPCLLIGDSTHGGPRSLMSYLGPDLEPFLIRPVEAEPAGILELIHEALALMNARAAAARRGEPLDLTPIFLVLEEWGSLMKSGLASDLTDGLTLIANEASRWRIWAGVCSQLGTKEAIGTIKDILPTRVAFRQTDVNQVRYAVGVQVDNTMAPDGLCVARIRQRFVEEMRIPLVTPDQLAALVPPMERVATSEPVTPASFGPVTPDRLATVTPIRNGPGNAPRNGGAEPVAAARHEAETPIEGVDREQWAKVLTGFDEDKDAGQLAQEVFGAPIRGGSKTYWIGIVQQIIRLHLRGLGPTPQPTVTDPPPSLPSQAGTSVDTPPPTGRSTDAQARPHGSPGPGAGTGGQAEAEGGRETDGQGPAGTGEQG